MSRLAIRLTVILLAVILLCLYAHLAIESESSKRLPDAVEIVLADTAIGAHELVREGESSAFIPVNRREAKVTYSALDESFTANVVATSPAYAEVFPLRMVEGSFLVEPTLYYAHDSVVIGSDAAIALFMRVDVVGEPLMIGDAEYTIVGVYETDGYFVQQMSTSLHAAIYVPVQTDEATHSVFMQADDTMFEEEALSKLTEAVNQTVKSDQVIQHAERKTLLHAIKWLLLELLCVIVFVWLGIRFARRGIDALKQQWYLYAGGSVLLLALFVMLQNVAVVPSAFLPADNIFDLGHYAKLFYSWLQSANGSGNELSILFTNTLRILFFLDTLIVLCVVLLLTVFSSKNEIFRKGMLYEEHENAFR